jgi:hypothetical protein
MGTVKQKKTIPAVEAPSVVASAAAPDVTAPIETKVVVAKAGNPQEFKLWDGRTVTMDKPQGVYTLLMYRLLGEDSHNDTLETIYRGVFHLKSIDGEAIAAPATPAEFSFIAGQLGDDALEQVGVLYLQHFRPRLEVIRPLSETQSQEKSDS